MNILVYKQKRRKCQNGLLKSIKHGFSHDYFMHMWPTFKVKDFEPNECK
jgi:hypothetical protein